ncbi:DEKNAAC101775 [Brettanomyces naardenensis]|uniref:Restriction of telomere capping protein 1 n=1 Tax=Brettanomyces naardenensis TaxID=13370 RepID=A0A448YIV8_BRENA|nr:DEKNAAC101775 [Brettanomyces naardenensis]
MFDSTTGCVRFQSSNEILALAKSNATPNLFVIGGPKSLQLARISESDITLEYDLVMQTGHGRNTKFGLISDLKFGHQTYGRNIAASTLSGSIHLYNLDRGNRVRATLSDHQRAVNSIDFCTVAPYRLVSGSQDGKMKIWDLRMRNTRAATTINGNADAVRCVQFNPRLENVLCSIFDAGVIQKWDLRKPNMVERRLNAHSGPGLALDWHPELDYIVTGGRDKQLQVWNMGSDVEYSREPDHVIYTSAPIFKVCWCRGRGNGSVMNTDIAACFLNDDPCVQIWNLNRRHIPEHIIECHSNQVTGLVWKTPRHLVSCSKDKMLVQNDVLREPRMIDNMPSRAMTWDPKGKLGVLFIKQAKDDYDLHNEPVKVSSLFNSTSNSAAGSINGVITSAVGPVATGAVTSPPNDTLPQSMQSAVSLASYLNSSSEKKIGRNPLSSRTKSGAVSRAKRLIMPKTSPFAVPVDIPLLANEREVFEFLSSSYLIEVSDGLDITQVCEYNATLAASAGKFRDCQTWKTIRFGIMWQYDQNAGLPQDFVHNESHKDTDNHSVTTRSQSDKYGTSLGSFTEESVSSTKELSASPKRMGILSQKIHAEKQEPADEQRDSDAARKEDGQVAVSLPISDRNEVAIADDEEDAVVAFDGEGQAKPMEIRRPSRTLSQLSRNRYSFTGVSVDLDNERSLSAGSSISLSGSPGLSRMFKLSAIKADDVGDGLKKRMISRRESSAALQRESSLSARSQLTAILKDPQHPDEGHPNFLGARILISENGESSLKVPWNPTDLIKRASLYSAKQGDLVLCATFALLFRNLYPESMTSTQAQEWIFNYHEVLLRRCLFGSAAAVLRRASESYDVFKTIGQTRTSVRLFCNNCHNLILNEDSKNKVRDEDPRTDFGFWYCDRCGKRQGKCAYCEEPLKGICVALLECGHKGHFGCFKSWFLEEKQSDCPACGTPAVRQ